MTALRNAYRSRRRWALVGDLVLVILFATLGRASHGESLTLPGIAGTAWPFVLACLVAWLAVSLLRIPHSRVWPAGLLIWLVTVAGGLGLRVAAGDTAALPFVIVASVTLALFLLVPRLLLGHGRKAASLTA